MQNWLALVTLAWFASQMPSNLVAQEAAKVSSIKVSQLAWIAGTWSSDNGGVVTEEQWLEPRAGMMVGVNRMSFPNGKATFEFLRIAETDKGLTYFASPSGKPATPFLLKSFDKQKVVFENATNDFPHRIIYEMIDDTLKASIEGDINGEPKSLSWSWKRATVAK